MIIRTANTETQSAVGHVPKERFENPSRGIRHTVRAQLAQYENAIGRSEWIIGRHHAVAVGAGTNQSAMGYGKLSSWERITERANASLIAASRTHVRTSDSAVRIDNQHSSRLPVRHAYHRVDFDWRAQFGGQRVIALNGIPAAAVAERSSIFDEHHPASANDCETFRIVQGYGKLLEVDFHDSACDSHFGANEQVNGPVRRDRYLD